jgi:hypothetical protein
MRVRSVVIAGACLAACVLSAFSASAQDSRITASFKALTFPIDREEFEASLSPSEREIYDLIEKLLYVRLKSALDVDDAAMVALAAQCGPAKDQLTMLKWERSALREHLRWCLDVGMTEAGLRQKLDTLLDYEVQIAEQLSEMVHASKSCLGAPGAAKLYLFVDDFEQYLAQRVSEALEKHHLSGASTPGERTGSTTAEGEEGLEKFEHLVRAENRDVPLADFAGEDVIKLVDALLMVRLEQTLGLSGEQSMKLFAHVGEHKDKLHELKWQIGGSREALREAIASGAPDEEILEQLDDLLIQERAVANLLNDLVTGAGRDISVEQSARLYLFLGDFEQYIVGLLERAQD